MLSEHFQSCSWDFLQPLSVLSPCLLLLLWLHPGRTFSRIKVSCTVLGLCFHLVCGSSCQSWGSTQALVPAQTLLQHFHLHCCQYCDKRQSLVTLLELMTLHLGRLSDTRGRYLFSTANAGSTAHLLINLNHSHTEKPLYFTMINSVRST